jgi:hypothetical protein
VHSHADHHHGALDALLQVFDSPTDHAPSKTTALPKPAVHLWLPWNWNTAFPWHFPVLHAHYLPVVEYRHPLRVPTPPPQRIS